MPTRHASAAGPCARDSQLSLPRAILTPDRTRRDQAITDAAPTRASLTGEQLDIVDWADGPLVVIAGAGTGKTRVIVERIRRLLERFGSAATTELPAGAATLMVDPDADPFAGPLLPEQVLVLTYNVKAAAELGERIEDTIGPSARARMTVSNFHQFCHQVLTESAADAGLPSAPEVLDGVGQLLLLAEIRPSLELRYYAGETNPYWNLDAFVRFINRAKDELVGPEDFDAYVARETAAFVERYGSWERALEGLLEQGAFEPGAKKTRNEYAKYRERARAAERGGETAEADFAAVEKVADKEARQAVSGTGRTIPRGRLTDVQAARVDELTETYLRDGAALEVLRLSELALIYHAYEAERRRRGALDFGEQIRAAISLFAARPNVLRRWQRRFRYLLVDEFQDANIAQIELVELLGRTPDRPDNVMVVGDDDQSIYRFRGSSYAAFIAFDERFSGPPRHDPRAPAPGAPTRMRIDRNFRSLPEIVTVANRLIGRNALRYLADKALVADREGAPSPVELVTCAGADDEAAAIVERIRSLSGWDPTAADAPPVAWGRFAVLYRKHKHREAIEARLRSEGIPYTVTGGLSLFRTPEIRDLEAALRVLADPYANVELARILTTGPWRLDALELLQITNAARRARVNVVELIRSAVAAGTVELEPLPAAGDPPVADGATEAARTLRLTDGARAKLRRLLETLEALLEEVAREGPFTVLEAWLERTGILLDLIATETLESRRAVANVASFLRFASEWQGEHPGRSVADFVAYLDAYQAAGGQLEASVELADDAAGVRLMTLYQAKGLEYPYVFVPMLLEGEWPTKERGAELLPVELLREAIPLGDLHTEEERRLLYVALTRARDGLMVTTHAGPAVTGSPSPFVAELTDGAGPELVRVARPGTGEGWEPTGPVGTVDLAAAAEDEGWGDERDVASATERVVPLPSPRERRSTLRRRAVELLSLLEGVAPEHPEAEGARGELIDELRRVGASTALAADEARAKGLDPVTLRVIHGDAGAGRSLLSVVPLPPTFSYSAFNTYEACPARYAFQYVYRIPSGRVSGALAFGSSAHAAFEAFTKERRRRALDGEPPPTREDFERLFDEHWTPLAFPDAASEEGYRRRRRSMLDKFWADELAAPTEVIAEELDFVLVLDPGDGTPAVRVKGSIDRLDRTADGGVEVVDYKTGNPESQKSVEENLQLSIYALACRDQLGLGLPERVTLYFTEAGARMSTTRTDEQLDEARLDLAARAARIRSGDFTAAPSKKVCGWCDFAALCPSRAE